MSVSGLKAELKFLASIFDKSHERFRIVSWKLDELHCQFLVPRPAPPGGPRSPAPPPLTLHCNITVRRPGAGPGGAPSARTEGARPSPAGTGPGPAVAALGRDGRGGAGGASRGAGFGPLAPSRPRAPCPEPSRGRHSRAQPAGSRGRGRRVAPLPREPGGEGPRVGTPHSSVGFLPSCFFNQLFSKFVCKKKLTSNARI